MCAGRQGCWWNTRLLLRRLSEEMHPLSQKRAQSRLAILQTPFFPTAEVRRTACSLESLRARPIARTFPRKFEIAATGLEARRRKGLRPARHASGCHLILILHSCASGDEDEGDLQRRVWVYVECAHRPASLLSVRSAAGALNLRSVGSGEASENREMNVCRDADRRIVCAIEGGRETWNAWNAFNELRTGLPDAITPLLRLVPYVSVAAFEP